MKLLRHKTAGMARQACLALALFCATAGAIADEKPVLAITVTGASEEVRENILARLPSYRPLCSATRDEAENYLLSAQPKIDSAIRAMGFYTSTSESRIARNADCWELTVAVKQGKPVTISSQRVTLSGPGRDDPVLRELVSRLPYAQGDIFRHDSYERYKSRLEQQASGRGYFDAQFPVHEILVNPRTHTADVRLQLDTGERYRYGSVSVEQTVLTPDYAEKYILIREGESFSSEELIKQQQLLQSSGYYADVRVTPLYRKARGGQVPVEISATPVKKHAYDARVGYGTDTGFRVGFDYERRWVSDKGAKIEASIGYSQKLIFGDISYVVPAKRRLNEYTRYTLGWRREYGEDVESKSIELGAEYVRKRSGWEQAAFLRYLDDVFGGLFGTGYSSAGLLAEHLAQADMRAAHKADRPGKAPAVAVEHRQGPEVDRVRAHAPDLHVADRVQVGAAVVIDHALGVAGGAAGVVEADGLPFIGGQ